MLKYVFYRWNRLSKKCQCIPRTLHSYILFNKLLEMKNQLDTYIRNILNKLLQKLSLFYCWWKNKYFSSKYLYFKLYLTNYWNCIRYSNKLCIGKIKTKLLYFLSANSWKLQLSFVYLQTKWQSLVFCFILTTNLSITWSTQTSISPWTFMSASL